MCSATAVNIGAHTVEGTVDEKGKPPHLYNELAILYHGRNAWEFNAWNVKLSLRGINAQNKK
jgi:hypothetical protein